MNLHLFFLFALCISKAAAYGLYGCYERLLYWQAYQMDEAFKSKRIAPACGRGTDFPTALGPVKGGRCNLRQFLYFIAKDTTERDIIADKSRLKDSDLAKERADLDEVAKKMHHAHIGRGYHPGHIYQGLEPRSDVDMVIKNVAGMIQQAGWLEKGNGRPAQELFDQAEKARGRVEMGRQLSGYRDVGALIRKKYDREVWDKQPKYENGEIEKEAPLVDEGLVRERKVIPPGATDGWISCDPMAAQRSLNAAGKEVDVTREFIRPWANNIDAHRLNILAVQAAKKMITEC